MAYISVLQETQSYKAFQISVIKEQIVFLVASDSIDLASGTEDTVQNIASLHIMHSLNRYSKIKLIMNFL